jgi:hypothetical protein
VWWRARDCILQPFCCGTGSKKNDQEEPLRENGQNYRAGDECVEGIDDRGDGGFASFKL